MKSLTFPSLKAVMFTKLESSTSQKRAKIAYNIDTGSDMNLMPFQMFKILLPSYTMVELNATTMLKIYDQSNIEQLISCPVMIRYNNKCVKCRFFVVLGNGPALLVM